jgi:hypothetical protein
MVHLINLIILLYDEECSNFLCWFCFLKNTARHRNIDIHLIWAVFKKKNDIPLSISYIKKSPAPEQQTTNEAKQSESRRRRRSKKFILLKHRSKKKIGEVILRETSPETSEQFFYTNVASEQRNSGEVSL